MLPADSAVSATFDVASLAVDFAALPVDFARELAARPAELPLLRADRALDDLELPLASFPELPLEPELPPERGLPPDAARERREPLLAGALGLLPLALLLREALRPAVRPRVAAARVLPDPEDPFDEVPEDDFAREDARPDEPREVVAAISLNLLLGKRPPGPILVG